MSYFVANAWGDSVHSPTSDEMQRFLDGIDPADEEHGAAWITDDLGNTLELNGDGTLVFDRDDFAPRHMPGVSSGRALVLWSLLARGLVDELEREPWQAGSRPSVPPEEAERRQCATAQWQLDEDRRFYDSLGPEEGSSACRRDGCTRRSISNSVLCRVHHFQSIRGRPCPFTD